VTSIKEGYEDYQRAKSDSEENTRKVIVVKYENGQFIEKITESKNVKAGDIIKLVGKSPVPADILLLMTSLYADGNQCYIETANIDGETNLKVREAPVALLPLCTDGQIKMALMGGRVEFEPPNKDIHSFIGALHLDALGDPVALGADNIILRGALFSNTDWAYAVVIYTGQETKIQMNNRHAESKLSKIEGYLNTAIIMIFWAQVILVSISVISIYILDFDRVSKVPYVNTDGKISNSVLPLWLEQW
jgi:phospholipid-transporting ATPase